MDCSSRYPEASKSRAYAILISTKCVHPCAMTFDESPCELTATALAKALARREICARDAARGPTGPLHGLPIAVKDLTGIAHGIWIVAVSAPHPDARRTCGGEASA